MTRLEHSSAVGPKDGSREHNLSFLIRLTGISVDRQRTPVLRSLDFNLREGGVTGIVGANGSGKTTLLQLVATLRRPAAGAGQVLGADVCGRVPADVRRSICLIGHQAALYPQLTLRENLQFVATMVGQSKQVADNALSSVGLAGAGDRRAERCSQGMIRRTDLARVLMSRPKLLLLDEPHAGLDDTAADIVDFLVDGVRRRGGGALVVSHDRSRLDPLVDDVLELANGNLLPARKLP